MPFRNNSVKQNRLEDQEEVAKTASNVTSRRCHARQRLSSDDISGHQKRGEPSPLLREHW